MSSVGELVRRTRGIARSLLMYHGVPGRHLRMVRFYGQFLRPGDLAFDVGAHVGSRVRAWRRIGARVVALEPQPDCVAVLRLFFGRDDGVVIEPVAVGAAVGTARLGLSSATPTVSSMSPGWISSVTADRSFAKVRWDRSIDVPVTTLDALIAVHGEPAFCKIDVEGFEVDVLRGLSRPLRGLSFEYLPPAHDAALAALEQVQRLGDYRYRYSPIETLRFDDHGDFDGEQWLDAAGLVAVLDRRRPLHRSGDVYAVLAQALTDRR